MKDVKSRLLANPGEGVRVGFSSEEFNDLPLIRQRPPKKKVTWRNTITNTCRQIDLLLFADGTTSLCTWSEVQNGKELMKQTFGDWKLTLNDDKWEHIIAENDPEERKRQRKKMDRTARMLGTHRNALGTFHHDQKHRLMAARKAWFKLSRKLPAWALTAIVGATLLFECEVRGFSNKEEKRTKHCARVWFSGSRDRNART